MENINSVTANNLSAQRGDTNVRLVTPLPKVSSAGYGVGAGEQASDPGADFSDFLRCALSENKTEVNEEELFAALIQKKLND